MDGALLDALQDWSRQAPYRQTGDWVFASPDMDGKHVLPQLELEKAFFR